MHLILGGMRSGKSAYAQQCALQSGRTPVYIATAQGLDEEMQARIARHQQDRGADWQLIEEPLHLADALQRSDKVENCIVVDCLTLWMTNLLMQEEQGNCILEREVAHLFEVLPQMRSDILFVSNEVGFGVMPMGELTRKFCDEIGFLHQGLATVSQQVSLLVAGIPVKIK
ncbi:MAG: bifunctional adenosylcobinamide kinase/adenosylcobinamide-phosphate guanylyltransferase [Gammaproteobacteria bacterium]|nr:bifunctional adenosylcobinamide kinase/adenosylcobinamide-phosphate guanylyltransferase [Gammaproteobacteria bacterium]